MRFSIIIILSSLLILTACSTSTNQVCFEETCFDVLLAQTPEEQAKGLMFVEELSNTTGMLFIFGEEIPHAFWMKNTMIPLDIIWLDSNQQIVHISKDTLPCKADPCPIYKPTKKALYVLEINAGMSASLGLKEEDKAEFMLKSS